MRNDLRPGILFASMRLPFTRHGIREMLLYGGAFLLGGVALLRFFPWGAPPLFVLFLLVLYFFRDPARRPEGGEESAVSPADGRVTDIEVVEEPEFLRGRALRIGIFLSVFNVHINRVPLDGKAVFFLYRTGEFLDARDPGASERNESNFVGFRGANGPFAVRQISGLIARRIVCPVKEGQSLRRGERMGMIKFGSRTELFVPADADVEVTTEVGRRVRGGKDVILKYRT